MKNARNGHDDDDINSYLVREEFNAAKEMPASLHNEPAREDETIQFYNYCNHSGANFVKSKNEYMQLRKKLLGFHLELRLMMRLKTSDSYCKCKSICIKMLHC